MGIRFLHRMRWAILRWTLYGFLGAGVAHWVIVNQGLVVSHPIWLIYLYVSLALSAYVVLTLVVNACIPRNITIERKQIILQSGQAAHAIPFERLLRWTIVLSGANPAQALLLLRYQDARGRRRRAIIGLNTKTDLLQLDRAIRIRQRLTRRLTVRQTA